MPDVTYIKFKDIKGTTVEIPKESLQVVKKNPMNGECTISASWEITNGKYKYLSQELSSRSKYTKNVVFYNVNGNRIRVCSDCILGFNTLNKSHIFLICMWYVNEKIYESVLKMIRSQHASSN